MQRQHRDTLSQTNRVVKAARSRQLHRRPTAPRVQLYGGDRGRNEQNKMTTIYTAKVTVRSGRDGTIASDDGKLEARLAFPKSLGGDGAGTNPEQLLAAGYAACFGSTLTAVAKASGKVLSNVEIGAEVDMLHDAGTYDLAVRLIVNAKGADRPALLGFIEQTLQACPYSRATRHTLATSVVLATEVT
ncbi:MAG: Ohr family peroxiredoxin [Myxococcales bacterium]|nr:Ohr family peroxiredoxin [Myxococcales bacterium]